MTFELVFECTTATSARRGLTDRGDLQSSSVAVLLLSWGFLMIYPYELSMGGSSDSFGWVIFDFGCCGALNLGDWMPDLFV